MLKEEKQAIMAEYATHEGDTGSPEVQIALLTKRINDLTEHLKVHKRNLYFIEFSDTAVSLANKVFTHKQVIDAVTHKGKCKRRNFIG